MNNLAKSAVYLMIATMLAKILGFVREMVLMYYYGTSIYSDVYITAMNIPTVIFSVIGAAIATTFIPLYNESFQEGGNKRALKFTNSVLVSTMVISLIIAVLGYIFAIPLVKLFAMKFESEKLQLTVQFVRIMIIGIVFIGFSNVMTAYLQVKENFVVPGMVAIPNNIIIIISIIFSASTGNIYILAIGALIGMMSQFLFQYPFARKNEYKVSISGSIQDKYIKKMILLVGPVLIGVCVTQINTMVDRSLASGLGDGIIAALNSANRLNWFVMGLFIVTLSSVIYPTLSKLSSENNKAEFAQSVRLSVNTAIIMIIPITIGAIILSVPIVRVLFERGAFDENSTKLTSIALVFYSIGMIGLGLRNILDRVFYSLKDTKTPMINGIIAMILNIVLNIILVKFIGHGGLALATSLSFLICTLLLFISLGKKIGYYGQDKILKTFIKSTLSSIIMGVFVYLSYNAIIKFTPNNLAGDLISLIGAVGTGVIVYGLMIIVFKVEEINYIVNMIKEKVRLKN